METLIVIKFWDSDIVFYFVDERIVSAMDDSQDIITIRDLINHYTKRHDVQYFGEIKFMVFFDEFFIHPIRTFNSSSNAEIFYSS